MNEKEFLDLIERYQVGKATADEVALLENLIESRAQGDLYNKLTLQQQYETREKVKQLLDEKIGRREKRETKMIPFRWMSAAAAMIVLTAASYIIWQYTARSVGIQMLQATSSGAVSKVLLPDGSIVWLKGKSTLTYPKKFLNNKRNVILIGEALFEVEKDPTHPFSIQCGELTTTVLGTSFNIKSIEKNIEVLVLTGKVSLTSSTDKEGVVVLPNEKVVYTGLKAQLAKIETAKEEKMATLEGTEYSMRFEDTRMSEIIRRIEGKFNVVVTTSDQRLGNCMITADFTDQSLNRTFNMISQTLGFTYKMEEGKISLDGVGCN
jgi:transmembrane sensor